MTIVGASFFVVGVDSFFVVGGGRPTLARCLKATKVPLVAERPREELELD